jgi:hypothetical protein
LEGKTNIRQKAKYKLELRWESTVETGAEGQQQRHLKEVTIK